MASKNKKIEKALVAVLRVRGKVHVRVDIEDALKNINLTRKNHATLIYHDEIMTGIFTKINDYATWGQISKKTLDKLLTQRGRTTGDKPLTDEYIAENSDYKNISEFADALLDGKAKLKSVKGLRPIFRLNPPVKGFEREGIKKPYATGGALGFRGEKMSELLERMI